jgi:hypothetical protein
MHLSKPLILQRKNARFDPKAHRPPIIGKDVATCKFFAGKPVWTGFALSGAYDREHANTTYAVNHQQDYQKHARTAQQL